MSNTWGDKNQRPVPFDEWDERLQTAMWIVLFLVFLYFALVVAPEFVGLLHRDGVL